MSALAEIGSSLLLFCLVYGMSATVDLKSMRRQVGNVAALLIGLCLQFIILPFCGFCVVKILALPAVTGVTLLVVTSSPGGSYSNWWCSMFNAELALSVTMTGISTLLSIIMLPANLLLYTRWTFSEAVVQSLDWTALFISLIVVISAITCGLLSSHIAERRGITSKFHRRANIMGNVAGISLIALSVTVSSTDHQAALWDQDARFYIGVALPALIGLVIATWMSTRFNLAKPERVAVAVEACYQNTGIATSVAITMFSGSESDIANAIGVPLYYGIVEAVALAIFCLVCWKLGWTKAPPDENICRVIYNSYEVPDEKEVTEQEVTIEVVLGQDPEDDVVVQRVDDGSYIVDERSLKKPERSSPKQDDPTDSMDESYNESSVCHGSATEMTTGYTSPENPPLKEIHPEDIQDQAETSPNRGRIGRAVSTIRARTTGYRKAEDGDDSSEAEEVVDSSYQTIPIASPTNDHKVLQSTGDML